MQTAYSFYHPLIEQTRREHYAAHQGAAGQRFLIFRGKTQQRQSTDLDDLAHQYEQFRIAARVIEEQLRINFRMRMSAGYGTALSMRSAVATIV